MALAEANLLHRFHTAFHYQPDAAWQRTLVRAGRICGADLERELRKRTLDPSLIPFVSTSAWRELIRLAAVRLDRSRRLGDVVWEWAEKSFDRATASLVETLPVRTVFGYEHACLSAFEAAKRRNLRTAYVLPAPEPGFVHNILLGESEKHPDLNTPFFAQTARHESRRAARRRSEWDLADVIMVASSFTKRSFERSGRDSSRVHCVPLGAPPPLSEAECDQGGSAVNEKPTFLWAGTFDVRKGAHYLLEAWERGGLGRVARLEVAGTVTLPTSRWKPAPTGIEFLGRVPHSQLLTAYARADALVFPTLCDGFGMVATEAWSRGTPVITTDRAGASDRLRHRENGLLVPAADAEALAESLNWCVSHRASLRGMRSAARATAAAWQWSDYRKRVAEIIRATPPNPSAN